MSAHTWGVFNLAINVYLSLRWKTGRWLAKGRCERTESRSQTCERCHVFSSELFIFATSFFSLFIFFPLLLFCWIIFFIYLFICLCCYVFILNFICFAETVNCPRHQNLNSLSLVPSFSLTCLSYCRFFMKAKMFFEVAKINIFLQKKAWIAMWNLKVVSHSYKPTKIWHPIQLLCSALQRASTSLLQQPNFLVVAEMFQLTSWHKPFYSLCLIHNYSLSEQCHLTLQLTKSKWKKQGLFDI